MGIKEVEVTAKKVKRRKITLKTVKIVGLILFLVLFVLFVILRVIYNGGRFTITLDPNLALDSGLIIYEDKIEKRSQRRLFAKEIVQALPCLSIAEYCRGRTCRTTGRATRCRSRHAGRCTPKGSPWGNAACRQTYG